MKSQLLSGAKYKHRKILPSAAHCSHLKRLWEAYALLPIFTLVRMGCDCTSDYINIR